MSKSLGNVLYLKNMKDLGFSPLSFRYLCLSAHYRSILTFSIENLESAQNSYSRLKNIISEIKDDKKTNKKYLNEFKKSVENDLDMPNALQVLWRLLRDEKAPGKLKTIEEMDKVFGLKLLERKKLEIPEKIQELADKRENARKNKDWKLADKIREEIKEDGYLVEDSAEGPKITKAN